MEPAEILAAAIRLADSEGSNVSHEYWELIGSLQRIPEQHVFDLAAACSRAATPLERAVGVNVLAQLGFSNEWTGKRPFTDQTAPILRALLRDEDERVLLSAIHAIGHHHIATADDLREFAHHPLSDIRYAVAFSLDSDESASQEILFGLMNDVDADVRDWATFAIGTQTEADTPAIREALARRLNDRDAETRGEAMVGLACRGDLSVVDVILEALRSPEFAPGANPGDLVVRAAEVLLERYPNEPRLTEALGIRRPGA